MLLLAQGSKDIIDQFRGVSAGPGAHLFLQEGLHVSGQCNRHEPTLRQRKPPVKPAEIRTPVSGAAGSKCRSSRLLDRKATLGRVWLKVGEPPYLPQWVPRYIVETHTCF